MKYHLILIFCVWFFFFFNVIKSHKAVFKHFKFSDHWKSRKLPTQGFFPSVLQFSAEQNGCLGASARSVSQRSNIKQPGRALGNPGEEVKSPPPKMWSGSKETPLLILLLLAAKECLAGYLNLQDPSYFNHTEKDWCFGVVLCYIKIHISNNKCFQFIQASLLSTEPNFQAVS